MTTVGEGVAVGSGVAFETGLEGSVGDEDGLGVAPGETCTGWQAANHREEMQTMITRSDTIGFKELILNGMIELYNL